MRRIAGVVAVALVIAGCTFLRAPFAPNLVNAPLEVSSRTPLPFCGHETVSNDNGFDVAARSCFWDAYQARRQAEFITTQPTIEGDPITSVYRVLQDGRVEVFVDTTYDLAGPNPPPRWIRLDCRALGIIEGAPAQPAFGPADCDETPLGP